MNPSFRRLLSASMLLPLALLGCGDSQGTTLRTTFLKTLAEDTILPTYREFDTRSTTLATALDALHATPTEATLAQAQTAWRAVREPWGVQEALHIGPSEDLHTGAAVDQVPSTSGIETLLAGSMELTVQNVEELGANRKGMMALEYMLFDSRAGDAAVLARLTDEGKGPRRRAYVKALGAVLHGNAVAVRTEWEPEQGNFVAQLATAGTPGGRYGTQKEAVDEIVNRLISSVEVAELKLSKPLGFETGGTVRPDEEEARRSDNSLADLTHAIQGMERLWLGENGKGGLSSVVASTNKTLDATVRADLAGLRSAVESIPPPLRTALTQNRESVEAARAAFSTLRATLASEVVANLGVTLKFNDNDGD
ncbi:imelysin family protein [Melittangium boletus]|uniref:Iron-regulated protein A n=1 Tax=Melittangium boletus DSM 14713 TaxID=1294270 RepID=A0A250IB64_9BACT|nr:imelysin family protein [Melittangium boletus]ATB28391.1 iron-regulated protein A precursor [Melittangium boletus DSM 14713]